MQNTLTNQVPQFLGGRVRIFGNLPNGGNKICLFLHAVIQPPPKGFYWPALSVYTGNQLLCYWISVVGIRVFQEEWHSSHLIPEGIADFFHQ